MSLADLCDVVYAIQSDQWQAYELAAISAGSEITPGDLVEKFDDWLFAEPEPVDREKDQLFAALGVGP